MKLSGFLLGAAAIALVCGVVGWFDPERLPAVFLPLVIVFWI